MKDGVRQSMAWLHTWAGLVLGWLLFFIFVTGAAGYFDTEIDRWMRPEAPPATYARSGQDAARIAASALRHLEAQAPDARRWTIHLPVDRNEPYPRLVMRANGAGVGEALLDPASGQSLAVRETAGGQLLYRMHYRLHYLPSQTAYWIVGVATMFMLVALITGVVVHKKIFADFFTFRPGKGQRSWLDAHNALSVTSLPFLLMITYSGLLFFTFTYMPLIVGAHYGMGEANRQVFFEELAPVSRQARAKVPAALTPLEPLLLKAEQYWGENRVGSISISNPGDAGAQIVLRRVEEGPVGSASLAFNGANGAMLAAPAAPGASKAVRGVFLALHEGIFAGPVLRWLYFLSGLLGAGMIATGLVLWAVKRRQQAEKEGEPHFGLRLVERLNIGAVVGLPVGIAAYFWANRLLPIVMTDRAAWEAHAMFVACAIMLGHAAWRPLSVAWREQLLIAAAAFGLLPVLNALTTGRHLGHSLPAGDWAFAGFDLTTLALGIAFAWTARRLACKTVPKCRPENAHEDATASIAGTESVVTTGGRP